MMKVVRAIPMYFFPYMLSKTIDFLANLHKNNNREWFLQHKSEYLEIKSWLDELLKDLIFEILVLFY